MPCLPESNSASATPSHGCLAVGETAGMAEALPNTSALHLLRDFERGRGNQSALTFHLLPAVPQPGALLADHFHPF